jgi:hypothetical protein
MSFPSGVAVLGLTSHGAIIVSFLFSDYGFKSRLEFTFSPSEWPDKVFGPVSAMYGIANCKFSYKKLHSPPRLDSRQISAN